MSSFKCSMILLIACAALVHAKQVPVDDKKNEKRGISDDGIGSHKGNDLLLLNDNGHGDSFTTQLNGNQYELKQNNAGADEFADAKIAQTNFQSSDDKQFASALAGSNYANEYAQSDAGNQRNLASAPTNFGVAQTGAAFDYNAFANGGAFVETNRGATVTTINRAVPVPYAQPVAVTVNRAVPVPVPEAVPVNVPRPVAVYVPVPRAVAVPRPVAYTVTRPVPVFVPQRIAVPVAQPISVPVPQPYAVTVPQPVPVRVPQTVVVPVPQPIYVGNGYESNAAYYGYGNNNNNNVGSSYQLQAAGLQQGGGQQQGLYDYKNIEALQGLQTLQATDAAASYGYQQKSANGFDGENRGYATAAANGSGSGATSYSSIKFGAVDKH